MKKILIIPILLILLGAGCSNNRQHIIEQQQKQIDELTQSLKENVSTTKRLENEISILEDESKTQKIQVQKTNTQVDLNNVLLSYKVDSQNTSKLSEMLLNMSFRDACPYIIASKTTRDNGYYLFDDSIKNLETKYGSYKTRIEYINNNIAGYKQILDIINDKCEAVGYKIN